MQVEEASTIIKRPYVTEKTFNMIEIENKISFIVDGGANKKLVKQAIEILYKVKVESVHTENTLFGKKAYVKLVPDNSASDLASRLGLV